jgi:hypothetical protein
MRSPDLLVFSIDFIAAWHSGNRLPQAIGQLQELLRDRQQSLRYSVKRLISVVGRQRPMMANVWHASDAIA